MDEHAIKNFFKFSSNVFYIISKTGKLLYISPSFKRLTGWSIEGWTEKDFIKVVKKEDYPKIAKALFQVYRGKTIPALELKVKTPSGKFLTADLFLTPHKKNGKIVGALGVAKDITPQRRQEDLYIHYANLIESSEQAIYSRDTEGIILTWNKAAEKLFGYKAEDVIGKSVKSLLPEDKQGTVESVNKSILSRKVLSDFTITTIAKDGKKVPIIAKISPITDRKGKVTGAAIFARDNSENLREKMYARALIQATNLLNNSLNYNITLKNLANLLAHEIADWSAVHIVDENGELVRLAVAHKDKEKLKFIDEFEKETGGIQRSNSEVKKVVETGKSSLYPYLTEKILKARIKDKRALEYIKKFGMKSVIVVPLLAGKKILGAITLVSTSDLHHYDKTDVKLAKEIGSKAGQAIENARLFYHAKKELEMRKKTEQKLQDSHDELEAILQNVADGITLQDRNGLVYANEAAYKGSGYRTREEMIKNPAKWTERFELVGEDGEPFSATDLPGRKAMIHKTSEQKTIRFIDKKTNRSRWSIVKASPILDEKGEARAVVNIINDITERIELERRKDDFIMIASHELKTPLTSMNGYLYLIKKEVEENDGILSLLLPKLQTQVGQLTELVQDLLDLSKIQTGKFEYRIEEYDVGTQIQEIITALSATIKSHKISYVDGKSRGRISADKQKISQVITNLIQNAIKYSPEGKKIVVGLKDLGQHEVQVYVRDFGIGIKRDERLKIFDRFYRVDHKLDNTFPGLGIGLFLSKVIIEKHGGHIWVESKKNRGSTFFFTLPRVSV